MARIEYPGSSGSNKLGALAGGYLLFLLYIWNAQVGLQLKSAFKSKKRKMNYFNLIVIREAFNKRKQEAYGIFHI